MIKMKISISYDLKYIIFYGVLTYLPVQPRRCVPSAIWFTLAISYTHTHIYIYIYIYVYIYIHGCKILLTVIEYIAMLYDNFTTWEFFFKKIRIWSVWKFEDRGHTDPFTAYFSRHNLWRHNRFICELILIIRHLQMKTNVDFLDAIMQKQYNADIMLL